MADKFQDKYRIPSARLQSWNYGWNAIYFITICTRNHVAYFGEIKSSNMILSETGEIATNFLLEIPGRYSYARLDEYVIMPNHVHMIMVIDKGHDGLDGADVKNRDAINRRDAINPDKNLNRNSIKPGGVTGNNNPMLYNNVSRICNWYKGRVTNESRKINPNYGWKSRFHDHIIRDDAAYQRIKKYIITNPMNWDDDKYNPQ